MLATEVNFSKLGRECLTGKEQQDSGRQPAERRKSPWRSELKRTYTSGRIRATVERR